MTTDGCRKRWLQTSQESHYLSVGSRKSTLYLSALPWDEFSIVYSLSTIMENMSPPAAPDEVFESTEFAFVTDQSPHDVRSHAMREHWKQRRRRKSLQHRASQQWSQPILAKSDSVAQVSAPTPAVSPTKTTDSKACNGYIQNDVINHSHERRVSNILDGIPAQVLSGMNLALGSSRLDPFDKFPIKLTAQHHKLLHHCKNTIITNPMAYKSLRTL